MKSSYIKTGFTLVELLIVVTILSILSTIAAIYLFDNFEDSRDAARKTDFLIIGENLELFHIDNSLYPVPDDAIDIMHEGSVAWSQGEFGINVIREIKNLGQDTPKDPKYKNYYSYSVTNNAREYQIATILEGFEEEEGLGEVVRGTLSPTTHAGVTVAYVRGDYNNLMVRAQGEGVDYYIASPSIIASDLSLTGAVDIITGEKLVYDEFFNLPASYSDFIDTNGGFGFNVTDPLVFSGSTSDLKTGTGIEDFSDTLKYIYATTPTESFDVYQRILGNDTATRVKLFLQKYYKVLFRYYFDCRDILDAGYSDGSGYYTIDVDGAGIIPSKEVYCDMTTGGGGWTKKEGTYIENGFFQGGAGIVGAVSSLPSSANQVVLKNNPAYTGSGYAMHQTGTNSSYYKIGFGDIQQVEVGDEIHMSLWVSDEDNGGWTNLEGINPEAYYMFYNEIHYTDGTFSTNGKVYLLDTKIVGGKTWKHLKVRHEVKKEVQGFSWFIGRDAEDTKNLYFTGVDLELYYGGYSSLHD